jgi:hypothetical protein
VYSITNKTAQVVHCRFNSGLEFNLAPHLRIDGVADSEIRDNRDLQKLAGLAVIEVAPSVPRAAPATPRSAPKSAHRSRNAK